MEYIKHPTEQEQALLQRVIAEKDPEEYDTEILAYKSAYLLQELSHMRANVLRLIPENFAGQVYLFGEVCQAWRLALNSRKLSYRCCDAAEYGAVVERLRKSTESGLVLGVGETAMQVAGLTGCRCYRCEPDYYFAKQLRRLDDEQWKQECGASTQWAALWISGENAQAETVSFLRFSNDRSVETSIYTEIVETADGERELRKLPDSPQAISHMQRLLVSQKLLEKFYAETPLRINRAKSYANGVSLEFISSETLTDALYRIMDPAIPVSGDEQRIQALVQKLQAYFALVFPKKQAFPFAIGEEFAAVYGSLTEAEQELLADATAMPLADVDLITDNLLLEGPTLIDYEWTFAFPIPTDYLKYRVLFYLYQDAHVQEFLRGQDYDLEALLALFDISAAKHKLFDKMEYHFQRWMEGERIPFRNLVRVVSGEAFLKLYTSDTPEFTEEHARTIVMTPGRQTWQLELPSGAKFFRLDPGEEPCAVQVYSCRVNHVEVPLAPVGGLMTGNGRFFFGRPDPILLPAESLESPKYRWNSSGTNLFSVELEVSTLTPTSFFRGAMIQNREFKPFKYMIDTEREENGIITVSGWGYSATVDANGTLELMPLDCEVTDLHGRPQEVTLTRRKRTDAVRTLTEEPSEVTLGFTIKWATGASRKFKLVFSAANSNIRQTLVVRKSDIERSVRESERAYNGWQDMLRHMNGRLFLDDVQFVTRRGLREYYHLLHKRCGHGHSKSYTNWRKKHVPTEEALAAQRETQFSYAPMISIIVPAYKTPEKFLREMIDSVLAQTYDNWQLCIADGSGDPEDRSVEQVLREYCAKDTRIKYERLEENLGISGNTNAALAMAEGEFISLLDHDDILAPEALYEVVKMLQDRTIEVVYTDEDKVNMELTKYYDPHFKPDFNPDMLRSTNYICHLFTVSREIADQVGGFREEFDGSQDYDFILRCTERTKKVGHVAKPVYHWRCHPNSTASNQESKMYCFDAGKRAIEAHLERMGQKGTVELTDHLGYYAVHYAWTENEKISIIIPNKDHADVLKRCVDSILEKSSYRNFEIIIVENNSTEPETFAYYETLKQNEQIRVVIWEKDFNYSAINNFGVSFATGSYLLFLNNDIEVITKSWMEELLGTCERPEVGAVGAKLYFPNGTIQHAGVVLGIGGVAGHVFTGQPSGDPGYFARAMIQQDLSAVTAACMMVRRSVYEEVSGFEEKLAVAFNDVDFCLKIRTHGYLVVYNPLAELYHHESLSRGTENTLEKQSRFDGEVEYMLTTWRSVLDQGDPYYNPNLTLTANDFSLS